jgi:hypothetical protein
MLEKELEKKVPVFKKGCTPPPGLVHWWPGDGDASDRVGLLDGTLAHGTTFAPGLVNEAFSLDGIDDVVRTPPLGLTSGTVQFWIYPFRVSGDTRLFSQESGPTTQGGATGFDQANLGNPGSVWVWTGLQWSRLSPNFTVPASDWSHLTFVYLEGGGKLYVNGQVTGKVLSPFDFNGVGLGIGAKFVGTWGQTFWGLIDEFQVFDRPLTDSEIEASYRASLSACDTDVDGDGVLDASDNCPLIANADQADNDHDGFGDACDADDDNDGGVDTLDNCPFTANPDQWDSDGDGQGDVCDTDLDGDGVANAVDNCPPIPNPEQTDTDGDRAGDACDTDADNDGVLDKDAAFTPIPVSTGGDNCPFIPNSDQADQDGDGVGNACDADLDGDGVDDVVDNCPLVPNTNQYDIDGDGQGDICDADIDGDGVVNTADVCGQTPVGAVVDSGTGCSLAQLCPCTGPRGTTVAWKNHGQYVSCVAKSAESFVAQGLIAKVEKDALVSAVARSTCGGK